MKGLVPFGFATLVLLASQGFAQQERGIAVTGYGELKTEPDIAKVSLGIFVFDKDLLLAKREADKKVAAVLATFGTMEIKPEDVTSSQLSVLPRYDKGGESVVFLGYEVTRAMTVTLRQIRKLDELLERSIQAGANRVQGIELKTSKENELKEQVLALAINNAKQTAGRIAAEFGAKLGKVVSVSVKSGGRDTRFNVLGEPIFAEKYQLGLIAVDAEIEVVFAFAD